MRDEIEGLKNRLITLTVVFIIIGLGVGYFLWYVEVFPIENLNFTYKLITQKEFIELKRQSINSVIEGLKVVATTFGGAAILFNVFYAAKRAKAMDDSAIAANKSAEAALYNAKAALKNAKAARDKQITERFTKAVELLGNDNISIRLGGIYALKRIAEDSEKDHWTIMEVLTAFVREKAPLKKEEIQQEQSPKIPTDIQAALTVIGRRDVKKDSKDQWLYLRNTDIRGADLNGANLQRVDFWGANLEKAQFIKADLKETQLGKAKLEGAFFHRADLEKAKLCGANLQWAKLQDANLTGTDFTDAYLNCADFSRAKLEDAKLAHATLKGANLFKANLKKTDFVGAYLEGTNLDEAENLEFEQLETAFGDSTTVLPNNIKRPAHWTQAGGETDAIAPI